MYLAVRFWSPRPAITGAGYKNLARFLLTRARTHPGSHLLSLTAHDGGERTGHMARNWKNTELAESLAVGDAVVTPTTKPERSLEHLGQPLSEQRDRLLAEAERAKEASERLAAEERARYAAD